MKLDLDRIAQLLHIEAGVREHPKLKSIHTAVLAELEEHANPKDDSPDGAKPVVRRAIEPVEGEA